MEHTNLFLYEDNAAMLVDYANGKVDTPVPGVAYARADENSGATVIYNKKKTTYTVTVSHEDRSGNTVTGNTTVESPAVLEGNTVKVKLTGEEVDGYKPMHDVEKIEISADTTYTYLYLAATSYTVTVNYMCEGSAITSSTTVTANTYEDTPVSVRLEPVDVSGYEKPEAVTIRVSSDTTYDFEYEAGCTLELVDLGLPSGTLWATKNLGAATPEDFGDYYAWGEIAPKTAFTEENYRFYDSQNPSEYLKYNSTDNKHTLDLEDDAAAVLYPGCEAHLPTVAQMYELLNNTTLEYHDGQQESYYSSVTLTSNINGRSILIPLDNYHQDGNWGDYPCLWLRDEIIYGDAVLDTQPVENGMACAGALGFACEGSAMVWDQGRNGDTGYHRGQGNGGLNIRPVVGDGPDPNPYVGTEDIQN